MKGGNDMYPNLEAEFARRNLRRKDIAKMINCNPTTLSFKLSGKRAFTLPEAVRLKTILNINTPIEFLFEVKS